MIWSDEAGFRRDGPTWTLTGQMLLWPDGSPGHVGQGPFEVVGNGWEAMVRISRSARIGSRWMTVLLRLESEVREQWEAEGVNPRQRAAAQLEAFVRLREWHTSNLGVLYLK
jgi:hypothetical protein